MGIVVVSARELDRAEILRLVVERRLGVGEAAERMGVTRRQASRLLRAFREEGVAGLASKRRGKPSNRRHPPAFRSEVMAIVAEHYADFGPTLAAEKLVERHAIAVGKETLRGWMVADGLWTTRTERRKRVHQPRPRRERFGELIQIDGSLHWWFEDRGPRPGRPPSVGPRSSLVHDGPFGQRNERFGGWWSPSEGGVRADGDGSMASRGACTPVPQCLPRGTPATDATPAVASRPSAPPLRQRPTDAR